MELNKLTKTIVLVSSGQPSLNPRLVKEADSLADAGYKVKVLYAYWNYWGTKMDTYLFPSKKWEGICIGGSPQNKPLIYLLSRLIHKLSVVITNETGAKYFAEFALARSSYFLIREVKKFTADLYIGHNLGALPAIVKAAKAHQKPSGFDAEDFHRYEITNDDNDKGVILKTYIENKYIPQVTYLSTSSPPITEAYHKLYAHKLPVTLLNVFQVNHHIRAPVLTNPGILKLFWFSQVVDHGRGLNDCIKALQLMDDFNIELHLLGAVSDKSRQQFQISAGNRVNLNFHQPVSPEDIIPFAAKFDIGLALEDGIPLNRDICLTNKIFTYMQAGLAIVASNTTAQNALLAEYPSIGTVYQKGDAKSLADVLYGYQQSRDRLFKSREAAFLVAKETLNWNNESKKLLSLVKKTLSNV